MGGIEGSLFPFYISRHNWRWTPEITMVLLRTEDSDILTRDALSLGGCFQPFRRRAALSSSKVEQSKKNTASGVEVIWKDKLDTFEMNSNNNNNNNNVLWVLPTTGTIPNKLHVSLKLLHLRPGLYILIQKAVLLNTCYVTRKCLAE